MSDDYYVGPFINNLAEFMEWEVLTHFRAKAHLILFMKECGQNWLKWAPFYKEPKALSPNPSAPISAPVHVSTPTPQSPAEVPPPMFLFILV